MLASRNDLKYHFCVMCKFYTLCTMPWTPKSRTFRPPPIPPPSPSRSGGKIAILLGSLKIGKAATKSDLTSRLGGAESTNFFWTLHKNTFSEASEHASVQKRTETLFCVWCARCTTPSTLIRNRNSGPSLKDEFSPVSSLSDENQGSRLWILKRNFMIWSAPPSWKGTPRAVVAMWVSHQCSKASILTVLIT